MIECGRENDQDSKLFLAVLADGALQLMRSERAAQDAASAFFIEPSGVGGRTISLVSASAVASTDSTFRSAATMAAKMAKKFSAV